MKPIDYLYHYRAEVVKVYDGDTITVDIDMGLDLWLRGQKVRLFGINTPEVRGVEREQGLKSRDFLRELILGKTVTLKTIRDGKGKYGRYLGEVWIGDRNISVNQLLVDEGLAELREY